MSTVVYEPWTDTRLDNACMMTPALFFWETIFNLDQISKESEEALRTEPVTMSNIKCKSFFERHRSADEINK